MKSQLKQLKKVIELVENDPLTKYTTEELRYMKSRYRQLREQLNYAKKVEKNGFGLKYREPVVFVNATESGPDVSDDTDTECVETDGEE